MIQLKPLRGKLIQYGTSSLSPVVLPQWNSPKPALAFPFNSVFLTVVKYVKHIWLMESGGGGYSSLIKQMSQLYKK